MRRQVTAAMIFNGHTEQYIEGLDEELFTEIQVMYADGLLGNKGIFDALTPLTTAVFNYFRSSGTPTIKSERIFPWVHEYSIDPANDVPDEEAGSRALLAFLQMAPGYKKDIFEK